VAGAARFHATGRGHRGADSRHLRGGTPIGDSAAHRRCHLLTKREGEITRLVLRGLSTAEVSGELYITPNTVRDHFKAIFDKVGVRSRRELVGQVFAQHYQPRMATGHEPDVGGQLT
jgi:DNA-binding CsgD family transcriptional regulator